MTCLAVNKYSRGRNRDARWRRRVWAWPRPQNWFDVLLVSPGMELLSKPYFRMSRKTYDELCNVLRADLIKQDTRMRRPVSVEKRVVVGLWRLANGDTYRSCGLQFAIGESTAKVISDQFESALCRLKNSYIRFPYTDEEVQEIMDRFEEEYHFPQIAGATGGSHIEIRTPPDNHQYYYNRKQFYSLVLQGGVDSKLPFSTHGNLLRQEKKFNEKFSVMRAVVERAFGMLKGRWRILAKKNQQHYKSVSRTVTAACVLHNFCQMQGESYDEDLRNPLGQHDDDDEGVALGGKPIRQLILNHLIAEGVL